MSQTQTQPQVQLSEVIREYIWRVLQDIKNDLEDAITTMKNVSWFLWRKYAVTRDNDFLDGFNDVSESLKKLIADHDIIADIIDKIDVYLKCPNICKEV